VSLQGTSGAFRLAASYVDERHSRVWFRRSVEPREVADLPRAVAELADRLWERAPVRTWVVGIVDPEGRYVEWTEEPSGSANVAKRVARRIAAEGAVAAGVARRPRFVGGWTDFEYHVVVAADADDEVAYLAPVGGERRLWHFERRVPFELVDRSFYLQPVRAELLRAIHQGLRR
jgi:hypothetical protein